MCFVEVKHLFKCFIEVIHCFSVLLKLSTCFSILLTLSTCLSVLSKLSTCLNILLKLSTCLSVLFPFTVSALKRYFPYKSETLLVVGEMTMLQSVSSLFNLQQHPAVVMNRH